MPADADDATREALSFLYNGVIYQVGGALLGLRPVAPSGDRFNEDRVGLDHLVTAGGITLTINTIPTIYQAGDIFTMTAGCVHHEHVGPNGVRYLAGRRDAAL